MSDGRPAARPNRLQALLWALFAQCAVLTAILVPVHILVQGILGPLGLVPYIDGRYATFAAALGNWLVKIYLIALIARSFYVFGHRACYLLIDLGVGVGKRIGGLSYGLAALGILAAAYVLVTVPG